MERYITGEGEELWVHDKNDDCLVSCVIHNPSQHSMRAFPTLWRADRGLMERLCPHGVGHPDPDDIAFKARVYGTAFAKAAAIHGCDGCCA